MKQEFALKNGLENYKIKVEKGIGAIKYNNENINKNTILWNWTTYVDVDSGIEEIEIK